MGVERGNVGLWRGKVGVKKGKLDVETINAGIELEPELVIDGDVG